MEDYAIGSTTANNFDTEDFFTYSTVNNAIVISSDSNQTRLLTGTLEAEADYVILVPVEAKKIICAPKDRLASLIESCGIPQAALTDVLSNVEARGFCSATQGPVRCFWYHVSVEQVTDDATQWMVHCWQVLDTSTGRFRILVFCPKFFVDDVLPRMSSVFSSALKYGHRQWTDVHLILMRAAIGTWQSSRWFTMSLGSMTLRRMVKEAQKVLTGTLIEECNQILSRLNLHILNLQKLGAVMQAVCLYSKSATSVATQEMVIQFTEQTQNLQNAVDSLLDDYRFFEQQLLLARHTLTTTIEFRNSAFTRMNAIALRGLAWQSQCDAQKAKQQTELSQKDSRSMTKIAYMTMLYLPASFVATLFGTPFLDLDDKKKFNNISQFGIYWIAALIFTVATFMVSYAWDRVSMPTRSAPASGEGVATEPEEPLGDLDEKLLEPELYVPESAENILQDLLEVFTRGDGGLDHGSSTPDGPDDGASTPES